MTKRNKIICLIFVILLFIAGFCAFMANYSEQKIQKQYNQIQSDLQRLPELLNEYDKYKKMGVNE